MAFLALPLATPMGRGNKSTVASQLPQC